MKKFVILVAFISLTACPSGPSRTSEGYLLTYVTESNQVGVAYSNDDGITWPSGTFPPTQVEGGAGVGSAADVDASGHVYMLVLRDTRGLSMWNGLGASNWEAQSGQPGGNVPVDGFEPSVAYAAPGKWLVAFRTSDSKLALHLYDSTQNTWVDGNFAPQSSDVADVSNVIDGPSVATHDGKLVLAWLHNNGFGVADKALTVTGTLASDGRPTIDGSKVVIIPPHISGLGGEEIVIPVANPILTTGGATFYLGYEGFWALSPDAVGQTGVNVLRLEVDDNTWQEYCTIANYISTSQPNRGNISLRGIAGRSNGNILAIVHDTANGFHTLKLSGGRWDTTTLFTVPQGIKQLPCALIPTGRPAAQ